MNFLQGEAVLPLTCDECGEPIGSIEDGWIEWLEDPVSQKGFGLRLVHHAKCIYREIGNMMRNDNHLDHFMGVDGFIELLRVRASYDFEPAEVETMVLRLNVPGYDAAFRHIEEAIDQGVIERLMAENHIVGTGDIQAILDYVEFRDNFED